MKLSRHFINLIILSCASSKIYSMEKQDQQVQTTNQIALSSSGEIAATSKSLFVLPTSKQKKGGSKNSFKTSGTNQSNKLTFAEEPKPSSKSEVFSQQATQLTTLIEKKHPHYRIEELSSAINEQLENGALSPDVSKRATQLAKIVLLCHEARAAIPRTEIAARKEIAALEKTWQLQINSLQPTEKNRVLQETGELSGYTSDGEYKADEASYGKFKTKNNLLAKITAQENVKNIESQKLIKQQQAIQKSIEQTNKIYDGLAIAKNALVNLNTSSATVVVSDADETHLQLQKLIAQEKSIKANIETLDKQRNELTSAQAILSALQNNDAQFVAEQKNLLNQKVTDAKVSLADLQTKKSFEKNPSSLVELGNQIASLQKQIAQDEADMKIYANHLERMEKRMNPVPTGSWFGGWWPFGASANDNSAKPVNTENLNKEEKK